MLKNCLHIVAFKNNLIKIIKLSCRLVFYPNTKCLKTIKLYVTRNQTMCSFTPVSISHFELNPVDLN